MGNEDGKSNRALHYRETGQGWKPVVTRAAKTTPEFRVKARRVVALRRDELNTRWNRATHPWRSFLADL